MESNQKITLKVSDMHCSSCPKLIQVTLMDIDGVRSAEANLDTKLISVEYNKNLVNPTKIINTIAEIGYSAQVQN